MPAVVACSGGDDDNTSSSAKIQSTPLSGRIGGQDWTMASGDTDSFLSDDNGFWATAYGEAHSDCTLDATSKSEMLLTIPTKPGDYPLGFTLTATFSVAQTSDSLVATQGHIVVDSITSTTITGGAAIEYDQDNSVNGRFTLTICP